MALSRSGAARRHEHPSAGAAPGASAGRSSHGLAAGAGRGRDPALPRRGICRLALERRHPSDRGAPLQHILRDRAVAGGGGLAGATGRAPRHRLDLCRDCAGRGRRRGRGRAAPAAGRHPGRDRDHAGSTGLCGALAAVERRLGHWPGSGRHGGGSGAGPSSGRQGRPVAGSGVAAAGTAAGR